MDTVNPRAESNIGLHNSDRVLHDWNRSFVKSNGQAVELARVWSRKLQLKLLIERPLPTRLRWMQPHDPTLACMNTQDPL